MNGVVLSAVAATLMLSAAGAAQAGSVNNSVQAHRIRLADNDVDRRTVVKEKRNGAEVRRTVTDRPNGNEVHRRVIERPNGTVTSRTVRERPNGNRIVRKAVRAPRRFRAPRWIAPRGFTYRRFVLGERVPTALLAATYFLTGYAMYGLDTPPPGYVWVRDGTDAVLVNRYTGEVVQVQYDVFY